MPALPVGKCRRCDAPVSYFAWACPYCHAPNQPNPFATIAALAVVLIGGLIAIGVQAWRHKGASQAASETASPPPASSAADDKSGDYGWIVQAMAECEEEARRKRETLHFLIVPVTATGMSLPGWSPNPIGSIGNSATLLHSIDAMNGLRNRALKLYPKPLTFAVSDPVTNTVFKWKPAIGVSLLKTRETGFDNLTLGFEVPDVARDIEWGPDVRIEKGTCYWINPLIRATGGGDNL